MLLLIMHQFFKTIHCSLLHCMSRCISATYSVQIWDAQIIEIGHNTAPSVGAAEIISSRLTNVREVR